MTTNADGSLTVTKADGSRQKVPPATKPTLIADKEGNAYLADGKGNLTKQPAATAGVANNPTTPAATTPFQDLLTEVINELKATEKQAAQLKIDSLKNGLHLASQHLQTATPKASAPSAAAYRPAITTQATDTEVLDPTTLPELQNSATLALLKDQKQLLELDQQLQKAAQRLAQIDTWQTTAGLQALVQTLPKSLTQAQLADASQRSQVRVQLKKALEDQLNALGK